jgi:hypothetical protein
MKSTKYLNETITLEIIEINNNEYKLIVNFYKGEFTHTHNNYTLLNNAQNKDNTIRQGAIDILIGGVLFFNEHLTNF